MTIHSHNVDRAAPVHWKRICAFIAGAFVQISRERRRNRKQYARTLLDCTQRKPVSPLAAHEFLSLVSWRGFNYVDS